ncbi:MAG: HAD-IIIA family hydrolase [Candidatus Omnitrophica bacterium]|nr:HAD-IIIA family hydrolase [Candidatus Omnitrophota bacterium]MDD5430002.1 HAD-IIIA family hydrolase [Candidatus Omnitrophota bacterium]
MQIPGNKKTNIKDLFKKVKLLILDVDGVLTGGEIIYDDRGRELKIFNVKDGLGVFLLGKVGIKTVILSARNSPVLQKRSLDMGVAAVIGGILPKEKALDDIKKRFKVGDSQICFIGDDLIDIGIIERVGLGVAVADSPAQVRRASVYVTKNKGGQGAVREIVDLILKAQGLEKKVLEFVRNPR